MKVLCKVGNTQVEAEGQSTLELFQQLAGAAEVFGQFKCGACQSNDVVPIVRSNGDFEFRELKCTSCGAKLAFGLTKAGEMYPRRKDSDGNWLDNSGWVKWNPDKGAPQQSRPQREDFAEDHIPF